MKFTETEIMELFTKEANGLIADLSHIALAYKINFISQAVYLKESIMIPSKKGEAKKKVVLTTKMTKNEDCFYAVLERVQHGDGDNSIPDSYELSFHFNDEKVLEGADQIITTNDPEYTSIIYATGTEENRPVNPEPLVFNFIAFKPIEVLSTYVRKSIAEGKDKNVEFEGLFTLDIVNGEKETKVILVPGSELKAKIKSDDVVQPEE